MIEVEDDENDAYYLSLVEEAEAEAGKSKRQKISEPDPHREIQEGPYMAALRGSRSSLWQQQQQQQHQPLRHKNETNTTNFNTKTNNSSSSSSSNAGACFKCGMSGHWARDCSVRPGQEDEGFGRRAVSGGSAEADVAEKECPCGTGMCLVLTSNTTKNPGRKFYRCPLKAENGGCNFFEWCDNPSSGKPTSTFASNYSSNSSAPDLPCPCGAGSCLVLTTKTGKNVGQQYYRCPANEENGSCGFFKWCNEQNSGVLKYSSNQQSSERSGSSCFKCGQGGHWSRDCPKPLSDSYADVGRNHSAFSSNQQSNERSGSSCFKCGEEGHWSRDCPKPLSDSYTDIGRNRSAFSGKSSSNSYSDVGRNCSASSGTCFKCGKARHWARDCP